MFMLNEHIKNIKNEITEYKKAMDDDFTFKEEKGDQAGGPETSKVDRKSGPETRNAILRLISENASITSREMANKLGINRSAVSKHLKKMQDNDIIHREGPQKSIVSIVCPLSWINRPFTFSRKKAFGRFLRRISATSKNKVPRVSSKPSRLPASEKA